MTDTLTIKDNRTGKDYEIEIVDGNISASQLRQIKVNENDFGMMSYDPGFLNTANCTSRITDLHGSEGIYLRKRAHSWTWFTSYSMANYQTSKSHMIGNSD